MDTRGNKKGDEFAVILDMVDDRREAEDKAEGKDKDKAALC